MRKKKGATLLEVVIAMAIISIMMVPILNSVLQSVEFNKKGEELREAKLIGQQVVEQLRNQDVIKEGQILKLNNKELAISSEGNSNKYNVDSLSEINGFNVDGVITRKSEVALGQHYDVEVGGFLIINKNDIYFKEATSDYKTFSDFYANKNNKTDLSRKISTIDSDIEIEIKDGKLTLKKGGAVESFGNLVATKNKIALIIHDKSDYKISINNSGEETKLYGYRSNLVNVDEGFVDEKIMYTGSKLKRIENILYDHSYKTKGLYSVNLDIKKNSEIVESLEYQFNVRGDN